MSKETIYFYAKAEPFKGYTFFVVLWNTLSQYLSILVIYLTGPYLNISSELLCFS